MRRTGSICMPDYADLNMDACIRAMEHDAMSSSFSFFVGSSLAETGEIDRMEEDSPSPSVALPVESVVPTDSECPNASANPVFLIGNNSNRSLAPQ